MANLIIVDKEYTSPWVVRNVTLYVIDTNKTFGYYGGQGVLLDNPAYYMRLAKKHFCQEDGKMIQHFILSFDRHDMRHIDENGAFFLGYAVCGLYPDYQMIFGVHQDTDYLHIHWVMNPVNLRTGKKFNFTFSESYELRAKIANFLEPYKIPCNLRTK